MNPQQGDRKYINGIAHYWTGQEWIPMPDFTEDYPNISISFPWIFTNPPPQKP